MQNRQGAFQILKGPDGRSVQSENWVMYMRKMQVLGIDLKDYSIRESMRKVDEFLHDGKVSSIAYITTKGLMEANESPEIREWMVSMDLTIARDADILHAAGVESRSRIREVEDNAFMEEFLRKLARGRKTVFLLAETKECLGELSEGLLDYQGNLQIVGTYAMEELQADEDYVVNEINIAAPNVIISMLPSPRRESFYKENHMKLNADIWMMVKDGTKLGNQHKSIWGNLSDKMLKTIFKRRVMRFRKETDE